MQQSGVNKFLFYPFAFVRLKFDSGSKAVGSQHAC